LSKRVRIATEKNKGERDMKAINSITITAAAVVMLAFSLPAPAFSQMKDLEHREGHAQMKGMEHREGHGQMMEMGNMDKMDDMMGMCIEHADKIGLSEAQIVNLKPVHREMQKKQARFKADQKIAEIELIEIMEVKDFDLEKANTAVKKIADIKTVHHLEMLKAMKGIRSMLTDDQFNKMKKMMPMKTDEKKPAKKIIKHQKG
jgi:hypothetical protein